MLSLLVATLALILAPGPAARPVRVLFIGNSYTFFHDVPGLLVDLGRRARPARDIEVDQVVVGGATLRDHWGDGRALDKLRGGRWDYVVLQEQSMLGYVAENGVGRVNHPEYFRRSARLFDREIRAAGARTVLFHTWAPRDHPEWQGALDVGYFPLARELNAILAPVGVAWQRVRRDRPELDLYFRDGRHPGPAGSYLAAVTLWAAIFGQSPVGLSSVVWGRAPDPQTGQPTDPPRELVRLTAADARLLQEAAWDARAVAQRGSFAGPTPKPVVSEPLPAGRTFTAAELEGTWTGRMEFYPDPTEVSLTLTRDGAGWKARWQADLTIGSDRHRLDYALPDVRVTDSTLNFEAYEPRILGQSERHRAVLVGDTLVGRAELGDEDRMPHFVGRWRLVRRR